LMVDAAVSTVLAPASEEALALCECARTGLERGLEAARAGVPVHEIGRAIDSQVRKCGFRVIPTLCGHGIGRSIHEKPAIPNFFDPRASQPLEDGLLVAIEPIVTAGSTRIVTSPDGWTLRTSDGSLAAHFEHTAFITKEGALVLTVE